MSCACGTSFNWEATPVEVPCNCLNLYKNKKLRIWGHPPCLGASKLAHVKLAAWRGALLAASSPVVAPVALIGLAVATPFQIASYYKVKQRVQNQAARHSARRYQQGSFEYNFRVHGNGRHQAVGRLPWILR